MRQVKLARPIATIRTEHASGSVRPPSALHASRPVTARRRSVARVANPGKIYREPLLGYSELRQSRSQSDRHFCASSESFCAALPSREDRLEAGSVWFIPRALKPAARDPGDLLRWINHDDLPVVYARIPARAPFYVRSLLCRCLVAPSRVLWFACSQASSPAVAPRELSVRR